MLLAMSSDLRRVGDHNLRAGFLGERQPAGA
jgi:hypothetical protein